ncbi:MAG: phenol hydroxylase [Steroidobacteraceae bacterium]
MHIDLRTITLTPLRQTFGHIARRQGDKPASRYVEGTMDLQPVENFHYRPTWDPAHEIFDRTRTCITMRDWYALKDPRQYYYGTWTLARGRMQETAEADFELVEEMGLTAAYPATGRAVANAVFLPLRHLAWGSNINNSFIGSFAYGIAMSQAATYASMDQLGVAQYLTRVGLALDGTESLAVARKAWLEDPAWQGLRRYVEDLMVLPDWFEVFIAQDLALEGLLYPLVFERLNAHLNAVHGPLLSLLTRFPREWYAESSKWVDAVVKAAAAENADNKAQLSRWVKNWGARAREALEPLAARGFGEQGPAQLGEVQKQFDARAGKAGLMA